MSELEKIKNYYGEKMMHLCRSLFPTLLEKENLLLNLLESNFAHSKFLYEDIVKYNQIDNFKNYIYYLIEEEKNVIELKKTAKELLEEQGYVLYECKTEEDIQSFKKYYKESEQLCTFYGGRLNTCYVFFAVKKNIEDINRKDFSKPERQDEYGTSVISIQFSKGEKNTLSIKNRYNHKVEHSDATFSNNLENIIPGLTRSFEKDYNLNILQSVKSNFYLPGYVMAKDRKLYKYNYEIKNIYYCPDNIIIDNFEVKKDYQEKEKYIITDYFIIDLVNKKISLYDKTSKDSFIEGLENIKKIYIEKNKETKIKTITITLENNQNAYIEIDKYNRIISYKNENLTTIGDKFLSNSKNLTSIEIPNVTTIGEYFLSDNQQIKTINLPKTIIIGDRFLLFNKTLEKLNLPEVTTIGNDFLFYNESLTELTIPKLTHIEKNFLDYNTEMKNKLKKQIKEITKETKKNLISMYKELKEQLSQKRKKR